jgi:hypothetical protein
MPKPMTKNSGPISRAIYLEVFMLPPGAIDRRNLKPIKQERKSCGGGDKTEMKPRKD